MAWFPNFNDPMYGFAAAGYPGPGITGGGGSNSMAGGAGRGGIFSRGIGLSQFLDPQVALPIAAALIGGRDFSSSLSGAAAAAGPAVADLRRKKVLNDLIKSKSFGTDIDPETRAYMAENPDFAEKVMAARLAPRYDTGLQPQYTVDEKGAYHQFLPSRTGEAKELVYPPNMTLVPPVTMVPTGTGTQPVSRFGGAPVGQPIKKDVAGAAQQEIQGQNAAKLPATMQAADIALKTIEDVKNDPAKSGGLWGTGIGGTGALSGLTNAIPGTATYDFQQKVNQLKGQAFLSAYNVLRGGGQISNIEGDKATQAIARLETAQTEAAFDKALQDLEDVMVIGKAVAQQMASGMTAAQAREALGLPPIGGAAPAHPKANAEGIVPAEDYFK